MSDSSDFFRGGSDLFPTFTPDGVSPANYNDVFDEIVIPAFNSYDGGSVVFPLVSTGNLVYTDAADAPGWTYAPTAVYTGHDRFLGGRYDAVDDLFWVATALLSTDTIAISTINAAGTIVNVGTPAVAGTAITATTVLYVSTLRRDVDGAGNLIINANAREIEINYTTGAIVTDQVFTGVASPLPGYIKVADGLYAAPYGITTGSYGATSGIRFVTQVEGGPITSFKETPVELCTYEGSSKGLPVTSVKSSIRWAVTESGSHVMLAPSSGSSFGSTYPAPFWYDKTIFLATLTTMAKNYGLL